MKQTPAGKDRDGTNDWPVDGEVVRKKDTEFDLREIMKHCTNTT